MSHFQNDNLKYTKDISRTDRTNPAFNPTVSAKGQKEQDNFTKNLDKYIDLVSFYRFYPDLWYDLITPETGGIRLDLDQRVFLRCLARFISNYGVFPRGYGKTYGEVLGMFHAAVWFPSIQITMTAQTKEAAAAILQEKYREITGHYPLLLNEIEGKPNFSKDDAEITFKNKSVIDILANAQSSKGRRRHRLQIEESAQINDLLFQDVLAPIPNVPRRTQGKEALINPEELNGQINFFTTAWFRQSDEFERSIRMVDEMAELKGKIVLGSDWQLACAYGRGEPKAKILEKKANSSPIFFATNYESKWVGQIDGGLVSMNKVFDLRVLAEPEFIGDGKSFYILAVDVARSLSKNNNQTSVAVLKVKFDSNKKVSKIQLVNLIHIPNFSSFDSQAIEIKRIKKLYNAQKVIVDINGLGSGLLDFLTKETIDPITGDSLGCWDTENTDHQPDIKNSPKIIYALMAQGINNDIIVNFIDMVESARLQLLIKKQDSSYDVNDNDSYKQMVPYIQTDLFMEEIANLKVIKNKNNSLSIEQSSKRIDKDRYSSVAMGLWYIKNFVGKATKEETFDVKKVMTSRRPSYFNKQNYM